MKKLLFTFALSLVTFTANAQFFSYDVNHDNGIDVNDVMCLVNKILGVPNTGEWQGTTYYLTCPDDNHPHIIDLGLPSGTKWACCNVAASVPEGYGGYYSWGEISQKASYNWSNYYHSGGSQSSCNDIGGSICGTEYDVAHVKWGGNWQIPSRSQIYELFYRCDEVRTTVNGVSGTRFTGPNGGSIFLPNAGEKYGSSMTSRGSNGYYWSGTLNSSYNYQASGLGFSNSGANSYRYDRYYGHSVRPVFVGGISNTLSLSRSSVNMKAGVSTTVDIVSGSGNYEITCSKPGVVEASLNGAMITLFGKVAGSAVVTVNDLSIGSSVTIKVTVTGEVKSYLACPDDNHPHIIDLGLPSGTKWACCNVEANNPEGYGGYYSWGEISQKASYSWSNYAHCGGSQSSCNDIGQSICGTDYDVANVKWGGFWQMPSGEQISELFTTCDEARTTVNGVSGTRFTGPNGGSIFLPNAGEKYGSSMTNRGSNGYYWSGTLNSSYNYQANGLGFSNSGANSYRYDRYYGHSVRPVCQW